MATLRGKRWGIKRINKWKWTCRRSCMFAFKGDLAVFDPLSRFSNKIQICHATSLGSSLNLAFQEGLPR